MPLSPKQTRFVAEYLTDSNATQAALRAGYSARTARQQGSQLLAKPEVAAAIAEAGRTIAGKLEVTAEGVIAELAKIAFLDAPEDEASLLNVKRAALVDLGKHLGLFKQSVPGDSPDNPVHTEIRAPDPGAIADIVARFAAPAKAKGATKH